METQAGPEVSRAAPAYDGDEGDRFSFSKFAAHPFFREVNEWLVARASIRPGADVVDLGCGPGAVTEIILRHLGTPPAGRVFAVDPSASALRLAAQRIQSAIVRFIQGTAERISSLVPQVDTVVFCNAIHLVPDKTQVVAGVSKVVRPGGVFAFNTTFFSGAYPADTYRFYKLWVLRAVRWLKDRGHTVARGVKATAMQWLSPEDYRALLAAHGFGQTEIEFQEKRLTCQAWEDISEFSMFIEGALPGVPLEVGAEALKVGVREAFRELSLQSVPRIWLQAIARRV
ncbi:MAG: methyltransferase domain-containing protein [Armatimonadota bacterium]|nr:methyltransferase domain-containing protein [Armatimonadota bacterium]MDR7535947.1 methyltransferase domain-containing protein [Armatimonadota bacterium]